jgi:hypothetical protein
VQALYRLFRSVRLAVALLLLLTALSILATLVPQGREAAFYFHNYPPLLARLITALGYADFFRSWLFLVPSILFFTNLAVCTVDRFARRLQRGARRRYGPDLVHVGLLLLIVGALLSTWGRWDTTFYLAKGESFDLPQGYRLTLLDYEDQRYRDGRPKDWISTVEATRGQRVLEASYPIEVNRPLRLRGLKVYQVDFRREHTAWLREPGGDGNLVPMRSGQYFEWEGGALFFARIAEGRAVFQRWQGHAVVEEFSLAASQTIGPYTIVQLSSRELTGLKAVKDPGFIPVLAALLVVAAGLALTFIQNSRDKES